MSDKLFNEIYEAIADLDEDKLNELTDQAISDEVEIIEAVEKAYTPGIKTVGEKYESGEFFLPELILAGDIVKAAITKLEDQLSGSSGRKKGKFLIGTVEGDIHDIGKDLVATMISTRDIEVIDIGVDCPPDKFIDAALENEVDIIGASCLLTMTAPELPKLEEKLRERGVRDQFYFVVGGAPIEKDWALEIGADGYAEDLQEAAELAVSILNKIKEGSDK
ncbi:cobalamin B12-binding domain-containing protein [Natranaerofaba carboxydovora]|uniref:cobalamin B12-binding domain-containing protein n=1 Tax=Natranaerofaba carboxydovora TaxID=2742683 RepID=UPI001F13F698|nr:cobalamin-dependent protein [Natranaerofaba carboxydovora]UMZ74791.1 Methionine synthase [Natranaerofaba carboxydovora]